MVSSYSQVNSEKETEPTIPHDVIELHILENKSLIRSWREYKGLSQQEVAQKMNITQAAYSQMEKPGSRLRKATMEKIASILEIQLEQLRI